ncbi:hypothetical protein BDY21DRAFT_277101 [Lineolata rhizophorae]|uniref:Cytochrome b5 heme-binding domain-containing protein n=1 Tax=Lineolata rhizophorae TaxID=578093 RepID=A0A6A6PDC4_9PEZI|nr:hypothetical protein BDY21DRAFT_277101 [Lineolata rhizophorae]
MASDKSALRSRKSAPPSTSDSTSDSTSKTPPSRADADDDSRNKLGVLDVLRLLGGAALLSCALSWYISNGESLLWGWRPWFVRGQALRSWWRGPVILTDEQLLAYDGSDPAKPIYVGLNGTIYDVSTNPHTYGPGGSYHFFAGRDAARAFITGCFREDLTPDLRGAEEVFVPLDPDSEPDPAASGDPRDSDEAEVETEDGRLVRKGGKAGPVKAELRERAEREWEEARSKVHDAIEGWAKTYRGETGKEYFEVGWIKREKGWLERLEPRGLCEGAKNMRPKRKKEGEKRAKEGNVKGRVRVGEKKGGG